MKRPLFYSGLTAACFIDLVLIVKLFSGSQFIRGFVGDIIVIWLLYFLMKVLYDFHSLKLAVFTLMAAYAVEFSQYLKLINLLGLQHSTIARLVLGSVFDPYDLIAYNIGALLVYFIDTKLVREVILDIRQ